MAFSYDKQRQMLADRIVGGGLRDSGILAALRAVPREAFVPADLKDRAYEDVPLPTGSGHRVLSMTASALLLDALGPEPNHRVLVVGGSGYTEALLSRIVAEVVGVIHEEDLAETARLRLERLGYGVRIVHGDGSRGWPPGAPWDRIVVEAGVPRVPPELLAQLKEGGRLLTALGDADNQHLQRITREDRERFRYEDLGEVRLVPLEGEAAFQPAPHGEWDPAPPLHIPEGARSLTTAEVISQTAEPIDDLETVSLDRLLDRIGDAKVVLLGEATHGTSEFYRMRARITQELVQRRGFDIVAVEADWPDAARIDSYVRHLDRPPSGWTAFSRFPTWMWRNEEVLGFVEWLREHNRSRPEQGRVGFYGLDLYSLYTSIESVLSYLDDVDPDAADVARSRYGCLSPFEGKEALYGRATTTGAFDSCEPQAVAMLRDLLRKRIAYAAADGDRFLDAARNAEVVRNAERYYRAMYQGAATSWNLRDTHMFDTLVALLDHRGPASRAVVWEHNSHVGDASATEIGAQGEINVGQLCRERFGDKAYLVGFGTHHGTVVAARQWDGPTQVQKVRPAHPDSYEALCHATGLPGFFLPLTSPAGGAARERLFQARLERAIGVVYRPDRELQSHYFRAILPRQFDEYIWFDETTALRPLKDTRVEEGAPETYPFGL